MPTADPQEWKTPAEEEILEGPLEENKPLAELRQEPIDLHTDFRWATMDLSEPAEVCPY